MDTKEHSGYRSKWQPSAEAWFDTMGRLRNASVVDRILVRTDTEGDCWQWMGARNRDGYGSFSYERNGRRVTTGPHLVLYEALVGARPNGTEMDHLCKNRACVNPDHLEPVSHADNVRRGASGWALKAGQGTAQQKWDVCGAGLHDLNDEANIKRRSDGNRQCRPCLAEAMREWRKANPRPKRSDQPGYVHGNKGRFREFCPEGHAYVEHGGKTKAGYNFCRTCKNARWRDRYHRIKNDAKAET